MERTQQPPPTPPWISIWSSAVSVFVYSRWRGLPCDTCVVMVTVTRLIVIIIIIIFRLKINVSIHPLSLTGSIYIIFFPVYGYTVRTAWRVSWTSVGYSGTSCDRDHVFAGRKTHSDHSERVRRKDRSSSVRKTGVLICKCSHRHPSACPSCFWQKPNFIK